MIDSEGCCQLCPERGRTFLYPGFSDQSYSVSAASHAVYLLLQAAKVHNFLSPPPPPPPPPQETTCHNKLSPTISLSPFIFPLLLSFLFLFLITLLPPPPFSPLFLPHPLLPSFLPSSLSLFLPFCLHTLYQTCKTWTSRYESSSGQRTTSCHGYTLTLASTMMRGSSPQLPQKYSRLLWYGPCLILKPNPNLVT